MPGIVQSVIGQLAMKNRKIGAWHEIYKGDLPKETLLKAEY